RGGMHLGRMLEGCVERVGSRRGQKRAILKCLDQLIACLWLHRDRRTRKTTPEFSIEHGKPPSKGTTSSSSTVEGVATFLPRNGKIFCESPSRPKCRTRRQLSSRMEFAVNRLEAILIDVRVDLSGGDVAVAKQFLHDAQVGSAANQMRGKAVPEGVRADRFQQAALSAILFHQHPKPHALQRLTGAREKESIRSSLVELRPALLKVTLSGLHTRLSDRHHAFLASLSQDANTSNL